MRRSAATRPRRRNGGGGPEEGGVVRRRGEGVCGGGPVPFLSLPFSRSLPHPLVSLLGSARPSSVPGAAASPAAAPRRAFSFVSALPRAPPSPRRAGRGLGGCVCPPAFRLRRRSPPGRRAASRTVPSPRLGTWRRGGGPPWRLSGVGVRPSPGGPRSLGSRGAPAVVCRVPPPALDGCLSVRRVSARNPALPLRVSPPRPRLGPRVPGRAPLLPGLRSPTLARPCPLVPRFPPQPPAPCGEKGPGLRVRGGTGRVGGLLGVSWKREGAPTRPGGFGVGGVGGVVGWRRRGGRRRHLGGAVLRHGPVASGVFALRGWLRPGVRRRGAAGWWASSPPLPRLSPTPCPGT